MYIPPSIARTPVYRILFLLSAFACVLFGGITASLALGFEVTAETTGCAGETGFTAFDSRRLYKIQSGGCTDPDTGEMLQQVLLKSRDRQFQYDVLWVTGQEARSIMRQIREIKDAKLKRIARPEVVIKQETVIRRPDSGPQQSAGATRSVPPAAEPATLPAPTITIIDPPISATRSMTNIITPLGAESRLIVGKVEAPAGLVALSVNGQPRKVDSHGMFKIEVPISNSKLPVSVTAVDYQGKRSSIEFRLLPETPPAAPGEPSKKSNGDELFGSYRALIIANDRYQTLDQLSTPSSDADAIASILRERYGFTVTRLNNGSRYDTLSVLNQLRKELTDHDNLLIYYAGHGEYDRANNRGHWLPIDAEADSTANWISTSTITDILNAMSAKHVLVVADSCYSGALTRSATTALDPGLSEQARTKWLRAIAKTRSRHVLTSGGVKPVLDDAGNGHSVFANALIAALTANKGVLEGSKLFREVKSRVEARAEELDVEQSPQYAKLKNTGHEFGEFLLIGQ